MRTVVAYENGRKVWSENVPAATGSSLIRGALVVGASGRPKVEEARRKQLAEAQRRCRENAP